MTSEELHAAAFANASTLIPYTGFSNPLATSGAEGRPSAADAEGVDLNDIFSRAPA